MSPLEAVAYYVAQHPDVRNYCVAYSAGVDSHVLLELMTELRDSDSAINLRAIHIDHSLQEFSPHWSQHAEDICSGLRVPLTVKRVDVLDKGDGLEASARIARYAEFSAFINPNEHLLLAQHAEDQAETFLLQALRGSGPDGLSAIPRKRRFAQGYMGRPLLGCTKDSLLVEARLRQLDWIEDPSNLDTHHDRNYLRHKVMPLLKTRWPSVAKTLGRSALRSSAASQILTTLAKEDLQKTTIEGSAFLSLSKLKQLPRERVYAVLRLWVRQRGFRMPRLQDLAQVMSDLVHARHDSNGIVNVRDYEFRRFKDSLCLLMPHVEAKPFRYIWSAPFHDLLISETGITLSRSLCERQGIVLPASGSITVKSRAGGELIKLGEPAYHKAVKKVLQESSVPPWQRDSIPLLYIDARLAAIWNVEVSVDFQAKPTGPGATADNHEEESGLATGQRADQNSEPA